MNTEIELCLRLPPEQQPAFARKVEKLFPRASKPQMQELVSIYYDTPALDLAQRSMGLRLRKQGDAWMQTLKFGQTGSGGLNQRIELEHPVASQALDLQAIDHASTRDFLLDERIAAHLQPVFTTRIQRTQWDIPHKKGHVVELALDVGSIETESHTLAVSEVEIELKEGDIRAVFAIGLKLAAHFSLLPQLRNKAERGHRVFQQTPSAPEQGRIAPLHADMSPWQARRAVLLECLRHLQANLAEIGQGDDMEYVHQARVAIRRMRSADRAFAALPADAAWSALIADLQQLGQKLGQVRDCDVLARETVARVQTVLGHKVTLQPITDIVLERREQHMQAVRAQLQSPRTGHMLLQILQWLYMQAPPADWAALSQPLQTFTNHALNRRANAVEKLARRWDDLDEEQRHTLRKQVKKLRYAAEFFSPMYNAGKVKKYLASQQAMQKVLGAMNDAAVAHQMLEELAASHLWMGFACGCVAGWYGATSQLAIDHAAEALQAMREAKPFWQETL